MNCDIDRRDFVSNGDTRNEKTFLISTCRIRRTEHFMWSTNGFGIDKNERTVDWDAPLNLCREWHVRVARTSLSNAKQRDDGRLFAQFNTHRIVINVTHLARVFVRISINERFCCCSNIYSCYVTRWNLFNESLRGERERGRTRREREILLMFRQRTKTTQVNRQSNETYTMSIDVHRTDETHVYFVRQTFVLPVNIDNGTFAICLSTRRWDEWRCANSLSTNSLCSSTTTLSTERTLHDGMPLTKQPTIECGSLFFSVRTCRRA
jgi:hypothetical protein